MERALNLAGDTNAVAWSMLAGMSTWLMGIDPPLRILILLTVLDIVLGFWGAVKYRELNSTKAKDGMAKNFAIVVIPMIASHFVVGTGYVPVVDGIVSFFILSQAISVLENWISLGLPFKQEWVAFFDEQKIKNREE